MKKITQQKGFTLVELAIVLVIIGLLIGGILKGQQLMENSAITATVAQVKAIEAATTSFRDAYGQMPGDLNDANTKITGCGTAAPALADCEGGTGFNPGDGVVGNPAWDTLTYQPGAGNVVALDGSVNAAEAAGFETLLFWHSLQQANLISAVQDGSLTNSVQAFGNSVPRAEIAGGFWVGYNDGTAGTTPEGTAYTLLGTILTLVPLPGSDIAITASDMAATDAAVAATIDRKLDDGLPASGSVQAYGAGSSANGGGLAAGSGCTTDPGVTGTELYNEGNEQLDCGVHITIQQ